MGPDADVRVIIADDHAEFRSALSNLLNQHRDIEVVAAVSTAHDAVTACQRLHPHVAVLDVGMPGNGLDAARHLANTKVTVLMLTANDSPTTRAEAATAGVHNYLVKGDGHDLVQAVLEAARAWELNRPPVSSASISDKHGADTR